MSEPSYSETLGAAIAGRGLTRRQAREAFGRIMDGKWSEAQIAAFLTALAAKGAAQIWAVDEYITATGSASTVDFVGRLFVQYIRVN